MIRRDLKFAEYLLAHGAGRSARKVLGGPHGNRHVNDVRSAAKRCTPDKIIYGLVVADNQGLAVPLPAVPGMSDVRDEHYAASMNTANAVVRARLSCPQAPLLRPTVEKFLAASGQSLGLGLALAFVRELTGLKPVKAVFVSATLERSGRVGHVDLIEPKLAIARDEGRDGDFVILVASDQGVAEDERIRCVASLDEAIELVFGATKLDVESRYRSPTSQLDEIEKLDNHDAAIQQLQALTVDDRHTDICARRLIALGERHRHVGNSDEASRCHSEALTILDSDDRRLAESGRIQSLSTRIDQYEFSETEEILTNWLEDERSFFIDPRHRTAARGMLAQICAMTGRLHQAVEVRRKSLDDHHKTERLRSEIPRTLAYLSLDAARAGMADDFTQFATKLAKVTPPGHLDQWRYNVSSIVRGLVALGRDKEAIDWLLGDCTFHGYDAPLPVRKRVLSGQVETHPEVTTVRALVRAYRKTFALGRAVEAAERVRSFDTAQPNLISWLAELPSFEVALCYRAQGDNERAEAILRDARARLPKLHPEATAHHHGLVDDDDVEAAIDRVWY